MTTVAFWGDWRTYDADLDQKVEAAFEKLFRLDKTFLFVTTNSYGFNNYPFEDRCLSAIAKLRQKYPRKDVSIICLEYTEKEKIDLRWGNEKFDYQLCYLHRIDKTYLARDRESSRWMLGHADYIVTYYYKALTPNEYRKTVENKQKITAINLIDRATYRRIEQAKESLPEREKLVLRQRESGLTRQKIADQMGVSTTRIAAIENRAHRRLRDMLAVKCVKGEQA